MECRIWSRFQFPINTQKPWQRIKDYRRINFLNYESETLDLKYWPELNYTDKLCVMCKLSEETIDHFMSCPAYGETSLEKDWKIIYGNDSESQYEIATEIRKRHTLRKSKLEEVGLPHNMAPLLQ